MLRSFNLRLHIQILTNARTIYKSREAKLYLSKIITVAFTRTVEASPEPVQVMKGHERTMAVLGNGLYERFERFERQLDFEARIAEAEEDTRAGHVRPMADVQAGMRAKCESWQFGETR